MRPRRNRALFVIDIAVPRDVEAAVGNLDQVFLYNIDDLQSIVKENLARRSSEVERAEVIEGVEPFARRLDSPMVGRDRQLDSLRRAFEGVAADNACHLFTILGTAGVGKSRLVEEFVKDLGGRAEVLRGRCLSYGQGITFWPVAEVVRGAAGVQDFDESDAVERKIVDRLAGDEYASAIANRLKWPTDEGVPSSRSHGT